MKKKTSYTVDTAFVLVLFAVFAITVLMVLMTGANVYKNTQAIMQQRYEERTCLSYITAKVNNLDAKGQVSVSEFNGREALVFKSNVGGIESETKMYYYGGYVRELTTPLNAKLKPSAGQKIVPAKDLDFKADGDLLTVTCTGTTGKTASISLDIASGMEAEK